MLVLVPRTNVHELPWQTRLQVSDEYDLCVINEEGIEFLQDANFASYIVSASNFVTVKTLKRIKKQTDVNVMQLMPDQPAGRVLRLVYDINAKGPTARLFALAFGCQHLLGDHYGHYATPLGFSPGGVGVKFQIDMTHEGHSVFEPSVPPHIALEIMEFSGFKNLENAAQSLFNEDQKAGVRYLEIRLNSLEKVIPNVTKTFLEKAGLPVSEALIESRKPKPEQVPKELRAMYKHMRDGNWHPWDLGFAPGWRELEVGDVVKIGDVVATGPGSFAPALSMVGIPVGTLPVYRKLTEPELQALRDEGKVNIPELHQIGGLV